MIRSRNAHIGFGIFAVIAIVLTWLIWSTLGRSVSGDTEHYAATFSNVQGLRVGDDVRMAGVRVGRVDRISRTAADRAHVDFEITRDQHLYHNTKALIRYQNLIGQRYVALNAGRGGDTNVLEPGGQIPIGHTEPSFDVSTLLAGFQPLFSVLQPDQINQLSQTLIQALQGNGVSLAALITQAATLAGTFGQRDAILGDVITNLSGVIAGLQHRNSSLDTLISRAQQLVSGFADQGKALEASVDRIATTTDSLNTMVSQLEPSLELAQDNATAAARILLGNGAALDRAAVQVPNLLDGVARFTSYGAYANAYFCSVDVSLWNVVLPRGLFSRIGGNQHSELCR